MWQPRFALKKTRVQLEKLEDRILLSAEPLLQLKTSSTPAGLAADTVAFDLLKIQAGDNSFKLDSLVTSTKATVANSTAVSSQVWPSTKAQGAISKAAQASM